MKPPAAIPVVVLLWMTALAGCAGEEPAKSASAEEPGAAEPARFTESTGAIEGLVVDDSITPISGALVGIKETGASATTDVGGAFSFSELEPGAYTLYANALGFESKGATVEVAAGTPSSVRFILTPLPTEEPYMALLTFAGLIECAWGVAGAGSGNCLPLQFVFQQIGQNPTNTRIIGLYAFPDPEKVEQGVFEMMWNPSAATTSGQLLLSVELEFTGVINGKTYASRQGPSPVRVVTDEQPFKELKPDENKKNVQTRTFPAGTNPPTFVVNQRFSVFATACYVEECPAGYTAIVDQ